VAGVGHIKNGHRVVKTALGTIREGYNGHNLILISGDPYERPLE